MIYAKELNQRNSKIANTLGDFIFEGWLKWEMIWKKD
jgi:hypothetical protein